MRFMRTIMFPLLTVSLLSSCLGDFLPIETGLYVPSEAIEDHEAKTFFDFTLGIE